MVVLVAAGCAKKPEGAQETSSGAGGTPAPRRPYVVDDAGIRFNPPPSWDAARIDVVSRSGAEAAHVLAGADFSVSFDYKAEQPAHRNAPLLQIAVLPMPAWKNMAQDSTDAAVMDRTDDWVFVAMVAGQNPYREGLLDADQFDAMRLTLDEVRNAFSIENGGPPDASLRAESRRK
jgi:hypothetical protein